VAAFTLLESNCCNDDAPFAVVGDIVVAVVVVEGVVVVVVAVLIAVEMVVVADEAI
jgi:hypothetical protein